MSAKKRLGTNSRVLDAKQMVECLSGLYNPQNQSGAPISLIRARSYLGRMAEPSANRVEAEQANEYVWEKARRLTRVALGLVPEVERTPFGQLWATNYLLDVNRRGSSQEREAFSAFLKDAIAKEADKPLAEFDNRLFFKLIPQLMEGMNDIKVTGTYSGAHRWISKKMRDNFNSFKKMNAPALENEAAFAGKNHLP
ncbi:Uncharacterised protein [uncultured archaeon]|nr:Uncharacterised protein [uncultured archaeon]